MLLVWKDLLISIESKSREHWKQNEMLKLTFPRTRTEAEGRAAVTIYPSVLPAAVPMLCSQGSDDNSGLFLQI